MDYNFEKFTSFNKRGSDIYANITRNNALNFSSGFGESNAINKYKYSVLYYDKAKKTIGIKFTNDSSEKSKFAVGKKKASSGVSIIAHSFFKRNHIDVEKYVKNRYAPRELTLRSAGIDESGTMFVIDLEEERIGLA